jgi:hypothetical protein
VLSGWLINNLEQKWPGRAVSDYFNNEIMYLHAFLSIGYNQIEIKHRNNLFLVIELKLFEDRRFLYESNRCEKFLIHDSPNIYTIILDLISYFNPFTGCAIVPYHWKILNACEQFTFCLHFEGV